MKSNITDNESAKMKSGHGVIQGYNAIAAVDSKHQTIVSAMAVGTQGESPFLKPVLEKAKQTLPDKVTKDTTVLADTGYFSEDNCKYLFESKQKAVIPDNHFRQRDEQFGRKRNGIFVRPENICSRMDIAGCMGIMENASKTSGTIVSFVI